MQAILLIFGIATFHRNAHADFAIEYTPSTSEVRWGLAVEYRIVGERNDCVINGYHWQYNKGCGPGDGWSDMTATPFNETDNPIEGYVGTFRVRCRLSLGPVPGAPAPPQSPYDVFTTITVQPPDGVYVVSGEELTAFMPDGIEIIFGIKCKGVAVAYGAGTIQEQNTEMRIPHLRTEDNQVKPWTPDPGKGKNLVLIETMNRLSL